MDYMFELLTESIIIVVINHNFKLTVSQKFKNNYFLSTCQITVIYFRFSEQKKIYFSSWMSGLKSQIWRYAKIWDKLEILIFLNQNLRLKKK